MGVIGSAPVITEFTDADGWHLQVNNISRVIRDPAREAPAHIAHRPLGDDVFLTVAVNGDRLTVDPPRMRDVINSALALAASAEYVTERADKGGPAWHAFLLDLSARLAPHIDPNRMRRAAGMTGRRHGLSDIYALLTSAPYLDQLATTAPAAADLFLRALSAPDLRSAVAGEPSPRFALLGKPVPKLIRELVPEAFEPPGSAAVPVEPRAWLRDWARAVRLTEEFGLGHPDDVVRVVRCLQALPHHHGLEAVRGAAAWQAISEISRDLPELATLALLDHAATMKALRGYFPPQIQGLYADPADVWSNTKAELRAYLADSDTTERSQDPEWRARHIVRAAQHWNRDQREAHRGAMAGPTQFFPGEPWALLDGQTVDVNGTSLQFVRIPDSRALEAEGAAMQNCLSETAVYIQGCVEGTHAVFSLRPVHEGSAAEPVAIALVTVRGHVQQIGGLHDRTMSTALKSAVAQRATEQQWKYLGSLRGGAEPPSR